MMEYLKQVTSETVSYLVLVESNDMPSNSQLEFIKQLLKDEQTPHHCCIVLV